MPNVSVLTCTTGRRPEAMALCRAYYERQTAHEDHDLEHVVVECDRHMRFNLIAAMCSAKGEWLVVMEDDDWYAARYVAALLEGARHRPGTRLIGLDGSCYYHVDRRRMRWFVGGVHASLHATAFHRDLIPQVRGLCEDDHGFIDMRLWQQTPGVPKRLLPQSRLSPAVVSMKGLYGTDGHGIGHRPETFDHDARDCDLAELIGEADASAYAEWKVTA